MQAAHPPHQTPSPSSLRRHLILTALLMLGLLRGVAQVNVVTYHEDLARTGQNTNETVLTPANVNVNTFGQLFSYSVDGYLFAQPLYVSGLAIPGKGTHNVVFVATAHNVVYAFDADDPAQTAPLWMVSFGDVFTANLSPNDIWDGEDGVLGTPVIDLAGGTLYVVSHHNGLAADPL